MVDKKEEEFNVSSKDFITSMFNGAFNEFIGKYHNKKKIGKDDKNPEYSYGQHYSTANGLVELYATLSEKEYLNKTDVIKTVKDLAKLYVESDKFNEFKEAIDSYLDVLNSDYKLDVSLVFEFELGKLTAKDNTEKREEKKEDPSLNDVYIEEPSYSTEPMLDPEPRRHPKKNDPKMVIFGILIAVILVIGVFVFMDKQAAEIKTSPELIEETVIDQSPIPVKYNFEQYLVKNNNYEDTKIVVTGFLKHELKPAGKTSYTHYYYVVDDYGNQILLSFISLRNTAYFDPLFTKDAGTTKDLFNVSGTLKKDTTSGFKLYVTTINPGKRSYISQ